MVHLRLPPTSQIVRSLQFSVSNAPILLDRICGTLFLGTIFAALCRFSWLGKSLMLRLLCAPEISDLQPSLDYLDPYKCQALLNQGRWLDNYQPHQASPLRNWQVPGCMVHEYTANDMSDCLESQRVVFVGDSTVRDIFWAAAKKLNHRAAVDKEAVAQKHQHQTFSHAGVVVDFVWDPYLNSTDLHKQLANYQKSWGPSSETPDPNECPAILLIGGGLWHVRHLSAASITEYKASIENVIKYEAPGSSRRVGSELSRRYWEAKNSNNLMAIAPVQHPSYETLPPSMKESVTLDRVNEINDYLLTVSSSSQATVILSYQLMTSNPQLSLREGGIHIKENIINRELDILLNLRCNAQLLRSKTYPMDKTCCGPYALPNWVQTILIISSLGILPTKMVLLVYGEQPNFDLDKEVLTMDIDFKRSLFSPLLKILIETSSLLLVLCYAFYADRTSLFNKVHKKHDPQDFTVLCLSTLVVGILSIRQPIKSIQGTAPLSKPESVDQPVLSRDQTDEWKGWMQYVILMYHYTGSSQNLGIYKVIRILVASYLFMTGFGHTVFFYKKSDYSLRRCAAVLIRLNFLSCLLPYAMGTDYLFYYFAPLITFWYMVIYLTMRIGHSRNSSMVFLVTKIMVASSIVTLLIKSPEGLETIFTVLTYTCNIKWDVAEWRFRLELDAYIVFVGMLCGTAFIKASAAFHEEQPDNKSNPSLICRYWVWIRTIAVASALAALPIYWRFAARFSNKADYNHWVPYLSWIPIISFVILRNCTRQARNFRSSFFVWLGRHSLETFILQFHIWLAADTKGLLALGVFGRTRTDTDRSWADFVLITIIFFWMSWRAAAATAVLTSWIVGPRTDPDGWEVGLGTELSLRSGRDVSFFEDRGGQSGKARFVTRMWQRLCRLLRNSLAARLLLILGTMWVLNWVSTP